MEQRLIGRTPGVGLNPAGWLDASRMAASLDEVPLDAIFASPQPRAIDTALAISAARGMAVEVAGAFDEMDFGAWSGLPFSVLEGDLRWARYNRDRVRTRPPGGESMAQVQRRASRAARALARSRPGGIIAIVTHAEVIRCLLLQAMGAPLDEWSSLSIAPGSVTELLGTGLRLIHPYSAAPSVRRSPRTRRRYAAGSYGRAATRTPRV